MMVTENKTPNMKPVFGEVTSRVQNTFTDRSNTINQKARPKDRSTKASKENRLIKPSVKDRSFKLSTKTEEAKKTDTNSSSENLSQKDSMDTEDDECSYSSRSAYSQDDDENSTGNLSSDYYSDDTSGDDESCLSYSTTPSTTELDHAQNKFLRDVKMRTKKVDTEYRNTEERRLRAIHLIACRHLKNGNLDVAQQKFEEILSTLVEEYGETHKRVGTALHNLGIVHMRAGNYDDAVDAIQAAVRIRVEKLGEYNPKVADSLVELGIVLIHKNEFDKSVDFFNEALSIREIELEEAEGKDEKEKTRIQLQIAKIHNNIGCAYFEVGEMEEAKESFECTLEIQRDIHDIEGVEASVPGQLAMSSTICNLGFVHLENAEWEFASDRLEYALKIQRKILDDSNKLVLSTLEHLGFAYVKYGNYDASLQIYQDIVNIKKSVNDVEDFTYLDVGDIDVANAMKKLVYCQMKLYKYEQALATLYEIEAIQELNYKDNDPQLQNTRELMGTVHYDMHKHPGFLEMIARNMTVYGFRNPFNSDLLCRCAADVESTDFLPCKPAAPPVRTKMSGHKVSYA